MNDTFLIYQLNINRFNYFWKLTKKKMPDKEYEKMHKWETFVIT